MIQIHLNLMKKQLLKYGMFLILMSPLTAEEISVAKVHFRKIVPHLREIVLEQPEHKEVAKRYKANEEEYNKLREAVQRAVLAGKKADTVALSKLNITKSKDQQEINKLSEAFLLKLIEEKYKDKYDLILKADYEADVLHSKITVDDLTGAIEKELGLFEKLDLELKK